jgi:hypothetical protein
MSSVPKIATAAAVDDLITTRQLQGAYKRASEPSLRETASRPLFEEFLNEYLRCSTLSVFGEQQLDQSQQAVDISVGYYDDEPLPNMVFVLLVECKRHKVSSRGALESQLQEYADRYLDTKHQGLAKYPVVYGATAYGTKIRFFKFSRESGCFEDWTFSGDLHHPKEEFYWDLKTDGKKIHGVLKEIWSFRLRLDQTPHSLPTRPAIRGLDGQKEPAELLPAPSRAADKGKAPAKHVEEQTSSDTSPYRDVSVSWNSKGDGYRYKIDGNWVFNDPPKAWQTIGEYIINMRRNPICVPRSLQKACLELLSALFNITDKISFVLSPFNTVLLHRHIFVSSAVASLPL